MTNDEIKTFIYCVGKLSDDWDAHVIVGAYKHLPVDDAVSAFVKDLVLYTKSKGAEKNILFESNESNTQKRTTIYDISQISNNLN